MHTFKIAPKIVSLDTACEFAEMYNIGKGDLVITSEHIWSKYFKNITPDNVIYIRNYCIGEPNDEAIKGICADIKNPYSRVIAVGGGTVADIAKLFALDVSNSLNKVLDALFDKEIDAKKDKKLVIVPTTCGTGSEITNISIVEFINRRTKFGLASDSLFADDAVLIPELLNDLPFKAFAASSIDALIHSVESFLSPKASALSEMFSVSAMQSILSGYVKIKNGENIDYKKFLEASTYAGIAFSNAGCAAVHALSYPLGAAFHVPHGEANYAVFTGVFNMYMNLAPNGKITRINKIFADILGCDECNVYNGLEQLLNESVLQKKALHEYGMKKEQISEFAKSVLKNQQRLLANNYVKLDLEQITQIYTNLY